MPTMASSPWNGSAELQTCPRCRSGVDRTMKRCPDCGRRQRGPDPVWASATSADFYGALAQMFGGLLVAALLFLVLAPLVVGIDGPSLFLVFLCVFFVFGPPGIAVGLVLCGLLLWIGAAMFDRLVRRRVLARQSGARSSLEGREELLRLQRDLQSCLPEGPGERLEAGGSL